MIVFWVVAPCSVLAEWHENGGSIFLRNAGTDLSYLVRTYIEGRICGFHDVATPCSEQKMSQNGIKLFYIINGFHNT
jgi:hypothetical protein